MVIISDRENLWDCEKIEESGVWKALSEEKGLLMQSKEKCACVSRILETLNLNQKKVVVLVHGFNSNFNDILKTYHVVRVQLKKLRKYDAIIGYLWPGTRRAITGYGDARDRVMNELHGRLLTLLREVKCRAQHLDVIAHSMGNRLVLNALMISEAVIQVDHFFAFGPAIRDDDLSFTPYSFVFAAARIRNISIFYSKRDWVLNWLFWVVEFHKCKGAQGTDLEMPSNVQQIDVSAIVPSHSSYYSAWGIYLFINERLNDRCNDPKYSIDDKNRIWNSASLKKMIGYVKKPRNEITGLELNPEQQKGKEKRPIDDVEDSKIFKYSKMEFPPLTHEGKECIEKLLGTFDNPRGDYYLRDFNTVFDKLVKDLHPYAIELLFSQMYEYEKKQNAKNEERILRNERWVENFYTALDVTATFASLWYITGAAICILNIIKENMKSL